jgi:hypothetical protein
MLSRCSPGGGRVKKNTYENRFVADVRSDDCLMILTFIDGATHPKRSTKLIQPT